ncbi:MAG: phosphoribosyltransferase family protein [Lachnospiraceae bacterium]
MDNYYDLSVCGMHRRLPYVDMEDGTAYASFVVISDTQLIQKAGAELAGKANHADIILTIEAKGIALAYEISRCLNMAEFVVVRKSIKPYVKSYIKDSVHSITTEGEQQIYLDEADAEKLKGRRVAIVDDVISKGESLAAAERLVVAAGGTVCAKLAILAEGKAALRTDITYLERLPLFKKEKTGYEILN